MQGLTLPASPVRLEETLPRDLLGFNESLGYFASAPQRLAPYVALAAQPGRPRSAVDITSELMAAATPALSLMPDDIKHVQYRLGVLFRSRVSPVYTTGQGIEENRHNILLNAHGQQAVPVLALCATRWLLDPDGTTAFMPPSITHRVHHGTRVAYLQCCLSWGTRARITQELQLGKSGVLRVNSLLNKFIQKGWLTRSVKSDYYRTRYSVADHIRPTVIAVASELHGLKDAGYAELVSANIAKIVDTPELYGTLAHAALSDIVATRRPTHRRRRTNLEDQQEQY